MWTGVTHLHHYLLEKGLDRTMVKPDAVEVDKEMVVGDVNLDHNGKDPNLGTTNVKDLNLGTTNVKDLNRVTIIRKKRQSSVRGQSPTMETKDP